MTDVFCTLCSFSPKNPDGKSFTVTRVLMTNLTMKGSEIWFELIVCRKCMKTDIGECRRKHFCFSCGSEIDNAMMMDSILYSICGKCHRKAPKYESTEAKTELSSFGLMHECGIA